MPVGQDDNGDVYRVVRRSELHKPLPPSQNKPGIRVEQRTQQRVEQRTEESAEQNRKE